MPISDKGNKITYGPYRLLATRVYWARRGAHALAKLTGMDVRITENKIASAPPFVNGC